MSRRSKLIRWPEWGFPGRELQLQRERDELRQELERRTQTPIVFTLTSDKAKRRLSSRRLTYPSFVSR